MRSLGSFPAAAAALEAAEVVSSSDASGLFATRASCQYDVSLNKLPQIIFTILVALLNNISFCFVESLSTSASYGRHLKKILALAGFALQRSQPMAIHLHAVRTSNCEILASTDCVNLIFNIIFLPVNTCIDLRELLTFHHPVPQHVWKVGSEQHVMTPLPPDLAAGSCRSAGSRSVFQSKVVLKRNTLLSSQASYDPGKLQVPRGENIFF